MSKRVYISADYDGNNGDKAVVDELNKWGQDDLHKVDFVDMAKVVSGSVSDEANCRICDLKAEFNSQINQSSSVICVVGDMTQYRTAGSACHRCNHEQSECKCTPYKQNTNGAVNCKVGSTSTPGPNDNVGNINSYSYLRHEFEQAKKKGKKLIIVYNSLNKQSSWLPKYMSDYAEIAVPFWLTNANGEKVGNYEFIKKELGYE